MALLFADAFASGDTSAWTSATDATVLDAAALFTGYGCRFDVDGTNNNAAKSVAAQTKVHLRVWVRLPTNASVPLNTASRITGGIGGGLDIYVRRTSGGMQIAGECFNAVTGSPGYSTIPKWFNGDWNVVEFYGERNGGADTGFLKANDRLVSRITPADGGDNFGFQVGPQTGLWPGEHIDIGAAEIYDAQHTGAWQYGGGSTGAVRAMWRRHGRLTGGRL